MNDMHGTAPGSSGASAPVEGSGPDARSGAAPCPGEGAGPVVGASAGPAPRPSGRGGTLDGTADGPAPQPGVPAETHSGAADGTPAGQTADGAAPNPPARPERDDVGDGVTNSEIAGLVAGVAADVRAFTERAEFYEDLVRQLQSRVESLQTDQVQQLLGPVLTRLAILLTQTADSAALARAHGEGYQADVEFEYFHDALIETLDLIGVESVGAAVGDAFDRSAHASRKSVRTGERDQDWTVAKVLRQGLARPGAERAFLPAQVAVYRYDAALEEARPAAPDEPATNPEPDQEGTLA